MKIKMTYGKCHIAVQGFDIECPFCKVLVKSGEMHDCSPATIDAPKPKRKARAERDRLREVNKELLEALKGIQEMAEHELHHDLSLKESSLMHQIEADARAAIAKAEASQ